MRKLSMVVVALVLGALPALGAKPGPLPDFDLMTAEGTAFNSRNFTVDRQWLILYLQPGCRSCETLLHLIKNQRNHPNLVRRIVIIEEGMTAAELRRLKLQFPDLAQARWYTSPPKSVQRGLKLSGAPVVLGMGRRTIQWSINGLLSRDGTQIRNAMESWTR